MSIEVANGTGTAGQAGRMTQVLAALGYQSGVTASPGYGHATTEVRYAPDSLTAAKQVAARIPGGATLVAAPDLKPTPLQPRGRHRVQLHRLDGGRFGLVGCVQPVDELDRHHPAGHQQRCVSAARRPGGPGGAALLTSPLRPLQRGQIERQVLLAY